MVSLLSQTAAPPSKPKCPDNPKIPDNPMIPGNPKIPKQKNTPGRQKPAPGGIKYKDYRIICSDLRCG